MAYRRGLLRQMSHVVWSVCLCVVHTNVLYKNVSADRVSVCGADSNESKQLCVRWESISLTEKNNFWSCRAH